MIAEIKDMYFDRMNDKGYVTFETNYNALKSLEELKGNKLDIEAKKHRQNRNIDQNAYLHVLINKLARKLNISEEETKINLNLNYGVIAKDENGKTLGCKVPKGMDITKIYKYAKKYKEDSDGCDCYVFYKETHLLNTEEFAKLLEGTIFECKEQNIETETPKMIYERYGIKVCID